MNFDAFIFDLDGTLLDTLPDLVRLTNMVLAERGMPTRTRDEINSFVGSGGRVLLQRAAVADASEADIDALFARWRHLYREHGHKYTAPYTGIPEALNVLKARGAKLGVLSNKFDAAVKGVISDHFPGVFDAVWGESPDVPRKPDPQGLLRMMSELGVAPERVVYVGDSGTDMAVARAAGAVPVGVSWGYRSVADLQAAGAACIVVHPAELEALALSAKRD
ncbi:MAG TPA: HAD family hydrolase [Eggerthellaceae bacterium]|nr:HAD family hydrolase [Eggerthellaceae bacterium]